MMAPMRPLTVFTLIVFLLCACKGTPDEEQIAQHVTAMKDAVERKDFAAIRSHLHEDFVGNKHMDAREVKQLLQMYSLQHRNIGVTIVGSNTTMDPTFEDRAETTLSVVATGSSGGLPEDGSVRTVKLEWLKESGDWRVIRAEWGHY